MYKVKEQLLKLTEYSPFFLIGIVIYFFYEPFIGTQLFDDEIAAYGVPALKVIYNNFSTILPWNYTAEDFFGHPPFDAIFYALILKISPHKVESLRIASLVISMGALIAYYEIGKTLKSKDLGYILVLGWLSHFSSWDTAYQIFADNLFHTLFLFFILAYFKSSSVGIVLLGIALILTRETAAVALGAIWVFEAHKYRKKTSNHFFIFTILFILQCSWFIFLKLRSGSSTPVYHAEGFFFEIPFMLKTLNRLVLDFFVRNYWFLSFILLFLGPVKEVFKKYWFFLLIHLTLFFGLTTITASVTRYQMIGTSSWIIFLALIYCERAKPLTRNFKITLGVVFIILFSRNVYLGRRNIIWSQFIQRIAYGCAIEIKELELSGKVRIGGWPIYEILTNYSSIVDLKWPPRRDAAEYVYFDHKTKIEDSYEYVAMFRYGQSREDKDFFKKLSLSDELEILPDFDNRSHCVAFRKVK